MKILLNRIFILLLLLLTLLISLYGCERPQPEPIPPQKAKPKALPLLGKDPLPDLHVVEDHSQVLARWAEEGIQNAVLIHIDALNNMNTISDAKIITLKDMYGKKDWTALAEAISPADHGLYTDANWIYAGAGLSMFKEIYWVIPYPYFSQDNGDELLRQFLKAHMFSDADIETFTMEDYRFRGTYRNIPLTLCDVESLPEMNEPLLLSVDTYFFPVFSAQYRVNYLSALNVMFSSLFNRNYRIQGAVLSHSIDGEHLPPHLRWVGNEMATVMKTPSVLNDPPSSLLPLLQNVDNAYRSSNPNEILRLADGYPALSSTPSLLLYKAYAHMLLGASEQALQAAIQSCDLDTLYCSGLSYIATLSFTKGQCDEAETFFRAAYEKNPDMKNGLYYYGHCLRDLGQFEKAITVYERDVLLNGSFPTDFLLAETYLMNDQRELAITALKRAIVGLEQNPYTVVTNQRAADAIYRVIEFTEKNGMIDLVSAIKLNAAVQGMFIDYPKK